MEDAPQGFFVCREVSVAAMLHSGEQITPGVCDAASVSECAASACEANSGENVVGCWPTLCIPAGAP